MLVLPRRPQGEQKMVFMVDLTGHFYIGIWHSRHGTSVAAYPTEERALLGLADCVMLNVADGQLEKEHALSLVELYRAGNHGEVVEYHNSVSDEFMKVENHPPLVTDEAASNRRDWSDAKLDALVERICSGRYSDPASSLERGEVVLFLDEPLGDR